MLKRPKGLGGKDDLIGLYIDELGTDAQYREAHTLFGNQSVLLKMLGMNVWNLTADQKAWAAKRATACSPNLTMAEKAKVARWVDTNCQYYGSYWGRRNIHYKNHPDFRIDVTFDQSIAPNSPVTLSPKPSPGTE